MHKISLFLGLLHGGKVEHDCSLERGLGYYLELLMRLAPYCKHPLEATLRGVTNSPNDAAPESLRYGLESIQIHIKVTYTFILGGLLKTESS